VRAMTGRIGGEGVEKVDIFLGGGPLLRCIGTTTKLCCNGRSFRLDSIASEGADCIKTC
jgi:hypothetical protein